MPCPAGAPPNPPRTPTAPARSRHLPFTAPGAHWRRPTRRTAPARCTTTQAEGPTRPGVGRLRGYGPGPLVGRRAPGCGRARPTRSSPGSQFRQAGWGSVQRGGSRVRGYAVVTATGVRVHPRSRRKSPSRAAWYSQAGRAMSLPGEDSVVVPVAEQPQHLASYVEASICPPRRESAPDDAAPPGASSHGKR